MELDAKGCRKFRWKICASGMGSFRRLIRCTGISHRFHVVDYFTEWSEVLNFDTGLLKQPNIIAAYQRVVT
jgi:hypothetical protein